MFFDGSNSHAAPGGPPHAPPKGGHAVTWTHPNLVRVMQAVVAVKLAVLFEQTNACGAARCASSAPGDAPTSKPCEQNERLRARLLLEGFATRWAPSAASVAARAMGGAGERLQESQRRGARSIQQRRRETLRCSFTAIYRMLCGEGPAIWRPERHPQARWTVSWSRQGCGKVPRNGQGRHPCGWRPLSRPPDRLPSTHGSLP